MEKHSFELGTGPAAETEHCENTTQMVTGTPPELHNGYNASRLNAIRHGVLSKHTVLPWESKEEYEALLNALIDEYAPLGPTEEHLVEEIAGVIWRKCRLRLAEAASYSEELKAVRGFPKTSETAVIKLEPIINYLTEIPRIAEHVPYLKSTEVSARNALEILRAGKAGAYDAALAELDEPMRRLWEKQITPESEDLNEKEDMDEDEEAYTAGATGLAQYLEGWVLPQLAKGFAYSENGHLIRDLVLGEAFPCTRLERLSRYEVHLDRKLQGTLAMLLRLRSLRQSNDAS